MCVLPIARQAAQIQDVSSVRCVFSLTHELGFLTFLLMTEVLLQYLTPNDTKQKLRIPVQARPACYVRSRLVVMSCSISVEQFVQSACCTNDRFRAGKTDFSIP
jgi:hypothetical protein